MKDLFWIGSSNKDIQVFPEEVKDEIGYALHEVQLGKTPESAKPFKISGEHGVYEIVSNFDTDTYRAVYAIKLMKVFMFFRQPILNNKSGLLIRWTPRVPLIIFLLLTT